MKILPSTCLLLLLLAGCTAPPDDLAPERTERSRLVLIGVDSLSWALVDPLLEAGELPHLSALRARGWSADLTTVEPLISPPNWTSIASGRSPEAHGIQTFFTDRLRVEVPTVWDRLAADGSRVGVYDYLLTWPPRSLPGGFMIPGWLRRDDSVTPADLEARVGGPVYTYEALEMGDLDAIVAGIDAELDRKAADFLRLADAFDLDVGIVTFYAVDVISHRFYHTFDPDAFDPPVPFAPRHEDLLKRTLRRVDRAVGEIVDGLGPDAHVVVVSDHGSDPSLPPGRRWGYDDERRLELAGLDPETDGVRSVNSFVENVFKVEDGTDEERDRVVEQLVDATSRIRTAAGEPVFRARVVREPEAALADPDAAGLSAFEVEVMSSHLPAHAFVFVGAEPICDALWPDGVVTLEDRTFPLSELIQAHDFTGTHHPDAFFLAAGPSLAHSEERRRLSVLDVAPLLFYLAGRPIPDDLEGASPEALLTPEALERRPLRTVAAERFPTLPEEDLGIPTGGEDEELRKRLRALGYVQ